MSSETGTDAVQVQLCGVSKRYGSETAVAPLDLTVTAGSFVTLLGPSGSGKTTTLKMIAGFDATRPGRHLARRRDRSAAPARTSATSAMVFQNYALFPHMTVERERRLPAEACAASTEAERRPAGRARRWSSCELPTFARRYPRELSGGQQQRVALARALVFQPRAAADGRAARRARQEAARRACSSRSSASTASSASRSSTSRTTRRRR